MGSVSIFRAAPFEVNALFRRDGQMAGEKSIEPAGSINQPPFFIPEPAPFREYMCPAFQSGIQG
jgi:hypothetical protein